MLLFSSEPELYIPLACRVAVDMLQYQSTETFVTDAEASPAPGPEGLPNADVVVLSDGETGDRAADAVEGSMVTQGIQPTLEGLAAAHGRDEGLVDGDKTISSKQDVESVNGDEQSVSAEKQDGKGQNEAEQRQGNYTELPEGLGRQALLQKKKEENGGRLPAREQLELNRLNIGEIEGQHGSEAMRAEKIRNRLENGDTDISDQEIEALEQFEESEEGRQDEQLQEDQDAIIEQIMTGTLPEDMSQEDAFDALEQIFDERATLGRDKDKKDAAEMKAKKRKEKSDTAHEKRTKRLQKEMRKKLLEILAAPKNIEQIQEMRTQFVDGYNDRKQSMEMQNEHDPTKLLESDKVLQQYASQIDGANVMLAEALNITRIKIQEYEDLQRDLELHIGVRGFWSYLGGKIKGAVQKKFNQSLVNLTAEQVAKNKGRVTNISQLGLNPF